MRDESTSPPPGVPLAAALPAEPMREGLGRRERGQAAAAIAETAELPPPAPASMPSATSLGDLRAGARAGWARGQSASSSPPSRKVVTWGAPPEATEVLASHTTTPPPLRQFPGDASAPSVSNTTTQRRRSPQARPFMGGATAATSDAPVEGVPSADARVAGAGGAGPPADEDIPALVAAVGRTLDALRVDVLPRLGSTPAPSAVRRPVHTAVASADAAMCALRGGCPAAYPLRLLRRGLERLCDVARGAQRGAATWRGVWDPTKSADDAAHAAGVVAWAADALQDRDPPRASHTVAHAALRAACPCPASRRWWAAAFGDGALEVATSQFASVLRCGLRDVGSEGARECIVDDVMAMVAVAGDVAVHGDGGPWPRGAAPSTPAATPLVTLPSYCSLFGYAALPDVLELFVGECEARAHADAHARTDPLPLSYAAFVRGAWGWRGGRWAGGGGGGGRDHDDDGDNGPHWSPPPPPRAVPATGVFRGAAAARPLPFPPSPAAAAAAARSGVLACRSLDEYFTTAVQDERHESRAPPSPPPTAAVLRAAYAGYRTELGADAGGRATRAPGVATATPRARRKPPPSQHDPPGPSAPRLPYSLSSPNPAPAAGCAARVHMQRAPGAQVAAPRDACEGGRARMHTRRPQHPPATSITAGLPAVPVYYGGCSDCTAGDSGPPPPPPRVRVALVRADIPPRGGFTAWLGRNVRVEAVDGRRGE